MKIKILTKTYNSLKTRKLKLPIKKQFKINLIDSTSVII